MRSTCFFASYLALNALTGCSALVVPDPSRLGGGADGGLPSIDAFRREADAFVPEGVDADLSVLDAHLALPDADLGLPDAPRPEIDAYSPVTCVEGSRCDGDVAVVCSGGVERRRDCAADGLICEAAECRPMRCTPGTSFCAADGSGLVTCNPDGSGLTFSSCPEGCDPGASVCRGADSCDGATPIALGSVVRFDLCDGEDTTSFASAESCTARSSANSADRTFVLTLREPATVEVDLRDADPTVGIDTIVSLRSDCTNVGSQLACSDDLPCSESDIAMGCSGGIQVRQSRFRVRLEAGTYYVVADAFRYGEFDCGGVELRVDTP
jgi:hypothetical protein